MEYLDLLLLRIENEALKEQSMLQMRHALMLESGNTSTDRTRHRTYNDLSTFSSSGYGDGHRIFGTNGEATITNG